LPVESKRQGRMMWFSAEWPAVTAAPNGLALKSPHF
jgi:hypothetical protein